MKFKILTLIIAVAVAVAFTSCKKHPKYHEEKDNDGTERVEKAGPTGNIDKDINDLLNKLKDVKDEASVNAYLDDYKKYAEFYNKEGKDAEFQKALDDATKDNPDLKSAMGLIQTLVGLEEMADEMDKSAGPTYEAEKETNKVINDAHKTTDVTNRATEDVQRKADEIKRDTEKKLDETRRKTEDAINDARRKVEEAMNEAKRKVDY